jgi:formate dehydrogenase subunit gamma
MIERYTLGERIVHWLSAATYVYVLATGLAFYTPYLYWIAAVLGGGPTARYWHPWIGLLFLATVIWMWMVWRADMRITGADRKWAENMRHYVRNQDELVPPVDRFNPGQKYFFWLMLYAGIVLLISGVVLWIPERMPPNLRFAAILLHEAAALATIGGFIIHVYMGVAVVPGGLRAMVRGYVSTAWARMHHRLWYDRVIGK